MSELTKLFPVRETRLSTWPFTFATSPQIHTGGGALVGRLLGALGGSLAAAAFYQILLALGGI